MLEYLICGANAQCPKCGKHRFSGPAELHLSDKVACVSCQHVCTAQEAIQAGLQAQGIK